MKYITSIWTTAILFIGLLSLRVIDLPLIEQLRLNTFDSYIRTMHERESSKVVLLNVGEDALSVHGQYPFPRHIYAQMISDLRNANAGYIGFTIMFPEVDRLGGDEVFASWVKDNGIILAQDADSRGKSSQAPYVGTAIFGTGDPLDWVIKYDGLVTNIPQIEEGAWGHGLINAMPEVDGLVRRIPLISQINDQLYPSFALETIRVLNEKPSYTVKVNDSGIEELILRPFRITSDSNGSMWINPNYKFKEIEYGSNGLQDVDLQGQTVLIGLTAKGLSAQIPTPAGLRSSHHIQAASIQSIMDGISISRPIWADAVEIGSLLFFGSILILTAYYSSIIISSLTFIGILSLSGYGVYHSWSEFQILLDLSYPLILYILLFTSTSFNNFYKQFVLRQQIKKQFETYLDPRQVMLLQKNPELLKLGGKREEMSFLFMDIVGFTPISEHYKNNNDPEGLVLIINNYLDRMTKIILANGGTIDKYMGDCIMAFWNAPLPCENHADMAVRTSIEILEAADELIKELEEQGLPRIDVGIGINTGDCIVGNMGSESRFDYSVIGDAVNLAARLEGQTRNYDGVRVLLSQFTAGKCSERSFTQVDNIQVKGKSERVTILTV
jgi:adenylate cyclase